MATGSAEHAHKPVIQYHAMEERLAVVMAKASRLLAGALMVRLNRASPAMPGPATGRAASGWPEGGAAVRQQCAGPAGRPAGSGAEGNAGCTA